MTIGDSGTLVVVSSGSYVMTGAAYLLAQLEVGTPPAPIHLKLTLTIQAAQYTDPNGLVYAAGTAATYQTTGTEFTVAGTYRTWLQVNPSGGGQITTPSPLALIIHPYPTP